MVAGVVLLATAGTVQAEKRPSYKADVFPIFVENCIECHQPGADGHQRSGLDMSTYEGVMKGTRHGPIVVPGEGFTSNLMVLIEGRARPEINMPHARKPIGKWQRVIIRRWINHGAPDN